MYHTDFNLNELLLVDLEKKKDIVKKYNAILYRNY